MYVSNCMFHFLLQAHKDPNMGKKMFLPLAEKMTQKYIKDDKIEAEAGDCFILLFKNC